MFDLRISEESISHFGGIAGLVACPEDSLCSITVDLIFFNESLLFEGQIWGSIYRNPPLENLWSNGNRLGEVKS